MVRTHSGFHGEADLDGHLPVIHFPLADIAARFDYLEPAQVLDGFVGALNGPPNSVLYGSGGTAGQLDKLIDGILHLRLCWLVHHQFDGCVAPQGFGIGTGLVRFVHDALNLCAVDSGELRVQFHPQSVTALVFLNQAHECPHR